MFQNEAHNQLMEKISIIEHAKSYTDLSLREKIIVNYYKSRSLERSGYFEKALATVNPEHNIFLDTDDELLNLITLIAQLYAQWRLGRLKEVFELNKQGNNIIPKLIMSDSDEEQSWIALLLNVFGLINWTKNDLKGAFNNFFRSLKIEECLKNRKNQLDIARIQNNIGNTYLKQGNTFKALDFYLSAKKNRDDNKPGLATSYNSLGRLLDKKGNFEQAATFHKNCLLLWLEIDNKQFIAKSYKFLGNNFELRGLKNEALELYLKSFQIFKKINNYTDLNRMKSLIQHINDK